MIRSVNYVAFSHITFAVLWLSTKIGAYSIIFHTSRQQTLLSKSFTHNEIISPYKNSRLFNSQVLLFATKSKKKTPAAAALEKLDLLIDLDENDGSLSKKELKSLAKQQKKKPQLDIDIDSEASIPLTSASPASLKSTKSKNENELPKDSESTLEGDGREKQTTNHLSNVQNEEKIKLDKVEKKTSKRRNSDNENEDIPSVEVSTVSSSDSSSLDNESSGEQMEDELTLEDKIRKERPPPRIRIMESSQQGYSSLRLENVGITFRNQQVLKDVTWGVQTGDKIGLVGPNGAGMSLVSDDLKVIEFFFRYF